jgi:uncharacterized protein YdeI (BOF family)
MKKVILSAIIMMTTTCAFAQYEAGDITVQPRVGFSAADFNNTSDTEARVGLVVGTEFEYFVSDRFSLAAGLNYSQQGAELKNTNVTWKLDYLTVPVVANVYLFKGFALKAGVQAGFKTNAKMDVEGGGYSESADLKDEVKSFDLSIPVGLSYEFKHFVLDARYNLGCTKIFNDVLDSKNLTFQLTLGYKIAL